MRGAMGLSMLVLRSLGVDARVFSPPAAYLKTTENSATREEVRKRLGPLVMSWFKDG